MGDKGNLWGITVGTILALLITTNQHSGYSFPWNYGLNLPFEADEKYHDYHHYKNVGNYAGKIVIWDLLFDTNTDFYYQDKVEEAGMRKANSSPDALYQKKRSQVFDKERLGKNQTAARFLKMD